MVTLTSDVKGATTDANVSILLYGVKGQGSGQKLTAESGQQKLVAHSAGAFTRGHRDEFEFECEDLGDLQKVKIEHDGSGKEPGWHLAEVRVQSLGAAKTGPQGSLGGAGKTRGPVNEQVVKEWVFPCDKWLDARHGDRQIVRELLPAGMGNAIRKSARYKLKIYTSDLKGAGTDADVSVVFLGDAGTSGERLKLPATQEAFERGSCDEFALEAPDVGSVKTLRIGHNNTGPSPSWHLDRVELEVLGVPGQGGTSKKYVFPCGKWFDLHKGDRLIERDLTAAEFGSETRARFTVTCHTSDLPGAGTDAGVTVVLVGERGRSGPHKLETSGSLEAAFERGRVDVFKLPECEAVGRLITIRIGHDGENKPLTFFICNALNLWNPIIDRLKEPVSKG